MPPVEVAGTYSTFGEQVSSLKRSEPIVHIGGGSRKARVYDKATEVQTLGLSSPGAVYNQVEGAFGEQRTSKRGTSPSWKIGARFRSDTDMTARRKYPGPGSYGRAQHMESAMGKQVRAERETGAAFSMGRSERFPGVRADLITPAGGDPRPAKGWMGDAPGYSFHGKSSRYMVGRGLPGQRPMSTLTPGAGCYEQGSGIGGQVLSTMPTAPRGRMGSEARDRFYKQYVSPGHEAVLFGRHSPGPSRYDAASGTGAIGTQLLSGQETRPGWGFGKGDRFAQAKSRPATASVTQAFCSVPGPGAYRV